MCEVGGEAFGTTLFYNLQFLQAFVIALTSDFIPKMVYVMVHSDDYSLEGYIDSTLSGKPNSACCTSTVIVYVLYMNQPLRS